MRAPEEKRFLDLDIVATARAATAELKAVKGQAVFEESLIAKSRQCEIIDGYEEMCLRFARDTRSKCAHPTGVVPSAEAVRHILHVCSQMVLCRRGYRGTSYVRRLVTLGFDDPHAFPYPERIVQHCDGIIDRVPQRLWPLFTWLAGEERPNAAPGTWRNNALIFFRRLLERANLQEAEIECEDELETPPEDSLTRVDEAAAGTPEGGADRSGGKEA